MGIDVTKAEAILLSHSHNDHTGGLAPLLELDFAQKPVFIAHPDAMMLRWEKVTSDHEKMFADILDAASEAGVPLEFNASGLRGKRRYPCMRFWEMASERENLKVVLNSDAHKPCELYDEFTSEALETARALKLNICNEEIAQKIIKLIVHIIQSI